MLLNNCFSFTKINDNERKNKRKHEPEADGDEGFKLQSGAKQQQFSANISVHETVRSKRKKK